jgi:uncharacterized membrane protein YdjX (TVP38/TMEM64 family)
VIWIRRVLLSRVLWFVIVVLVLAVAANRWMNEHGGIRATVERWGVLAPLVSLALATLTNVTPIGGLGFSILNGALFPFWVAVFLNLTSGIFGGTLMYFVWRRGDHEFDIRSGIQKLPHWFRRHAGDNLLFLIVLRYLPWAGGALADMIAGSHRVPLRTQLLSCTLGYLPGAFVYALIGAGLVRL